MINLLPSESKEQYVYGRRNSTLRRWAIALGGGLLGVLFVTFGGLFIIEGSINSYQAKVASSSGVLKEQDLKGVREHTKSITSSIRLATDVLSREILFSQLLDHVATVIPTNTSLTDFTVGADQTTIELKALAVDYASATQLQINLADPANKIFTKADIQMIDCNTSTDPHYPCNVTIQALFSDNNPFLFINKDAE